MKSINAIFLADSHLGYDHPLKPRLERKRRGEDFFRHFEQILDVAIQTKTDFLIHGGDLFDSPYVNQSLVNRTYFKIFEVAEAGIPIFIVPGNHERAMLPTSVYMQHPNIQIFNKAKTVHLTCQNQKVAVSGFPYYYDGIRHDFSELLNTFRKDLTKNSLNVMCLHQAVEGAQVGLHNYTFRSNSDVIKIKELSDDYLCYLSGHIHRHQIIRNPENNVPFIYPGSIERTSYQEGNEVKGYSRLRFVKSSDNFELEHQFIELESRPLETLVFENRMYSAKEIKEFVLSKVNQISKNAVLRYKSELPENLYKMTSQLEKELIPNSISIQKWIRSQIRKHQVKTGK